MDELIWKKHPDYNVEVSNYGHFRNIGTDTDFINNTKRTVAALVYEAFNEVKLKPYTNVVPKNMNPYDMRVCNLDIVKAGDMARIKQDRAFVNETVNQMILKEPFISQFYEPEAYFVLLGMPLRMIKNWKKVKHPKPRKLKNKFV